MSLAEPIEHTGEVRRRSWLKRIAVAVGALIGGALLVTVAVVAYLWLRVPTDHPHPLLTGRLAVDATIEQPLRTGPFRVAVTGGPLAAITVTQDREGTDEDLVVWHSDPGTPFVTAGVGSVSFTERFGYFWPDVHRTHRLVNQTVTGVRTTRGAVEISGTLTGDQTTAEYVLRLSPAPKNDDVKALRLDVSVARTSMGAEVSSTQLVSGRERGERVHGLGEQFRPFDLSGTITPILPREQGIGRGEQPITFLADITNWAGGDLATTYAALPTYVTSEYRSLSLVDTVDSGAFGIADFQRPDVAALESWAPSFTAEALVAASPEDLMRARGAGTTRPPLADWVQRGAVLGLQGGTERVLAIVDQMQAAGTEIAAVWLQDWTGQRTTSFGDRLWWTWQLDRERYPDWKRMVGDLNDRGIRVLTYVNPWLVDGAEKGDRDGEHLFDVAEKRGYLVRSPAGGPYLVDQNGFSAAAVDFTNPRARDWYSDVIAERVLGIGADGFMADFGEGLPPDAVLAHSTPALQHNRWPQLWAGVVRQGCERAGQPDCVTFMRSAYLDSPAQVPLMWAGDQMVDFAPEDGLASAIYGMASGGVSGLPLWHSDIGGYTSVNSFVTNYVRPPDLLQRWSEMQAFGVMMRTHEGNRPAQNRQVYDTLESRAAFARTTQLYAALHRYRKAVVDEAVATGVPAVRHPWLVYPDAAVASADLQFFLGEHLMVAPVTRQGDTAVRVTFPPGTWVHALTGQTFAGDRTVDVDAPLGTPAAFVRHNDPEGDRIRAELREVGLATG